MLLEQLGQNSPITKQAVQDLLGLPPEETVNGFVSALASREAQSPLTTVAELTARGRDLGMFLEEAAARARDRIIAGEAGLIPVARALVGWRAELPRVVSRRLHVELGILELCDPPAERTQAARRPHLNREANRTGEGTTVAETSTPPSTQSAPPPETASSPPPVTVTQDPAWQELLEDCYRQSRALAVFLLPAKHHLADGTLRIILPADYRFHYDCLQEPSLREALEQAAQRHFGALLAIHIEWEGVEDPGPSLEERAALAAEVLEGEIVKEQSA